jgi:N-acetylneuraminate synthase
MTTATPFIIAEAGVNHNGRLDLALRLVDAAAEAKADAVKFQAFRAERLATKTAPLARYQEKSERSDGGQLEMLRRLQLDESQFAEIAARCAARGIELMATPFDVDSVAMLQRLGVKRFKIPSGEANNPLLLRAVAATDKPLILSTGMCTLAEVETALTIIGRVFLGDPKAEPLVSDAGRALLASRVTVLHCTTEYPAPPSSANLRAMTTMAAAFGVPVGYSDHTEGPAVSIAAVALGATVIEKHFTLDRTLPGPDHAASLEAGELAGFVEALRSVGAAMGNGIKVPQAAELPNRSVARRSVVAARSIKKGEAFTTENLALKRPGTGIPASRYDELLGRIATRDYVEDELIEL